MKKLFILFVGTALLAMSACHPRVDTKAEKTEAQAVVNQMIQAFETKDINLFAKITAHDPDMVNFGTDAAERWVGWDALKAAVEKQFAAFDKIKLTAKDQVVHVNPSGNTAWFSEVVDWDIVEKGKPTHMEGSRLTGVLEKRDGNWVIVQFHVSIPVPIQAAQY
ncbi:MAG: nuclear transport factor 2 family protein [Deltaproteobacteria bacterium]